MTPEDASGNGGRPLAVEVAIIGAGPVGLMTANLLGLAGIRVLVLERNAGLLGLPRAIAYDAETLRLFSQVGLFDEIAPGLIQDPHVRHLNARNVTLMAADFPRGLYGHSSLGTFYQPDFERVLLKGLARFPSVRVAFEHEATDLVQNAKGVTLSVATPSGATTVEADYVVACDGGASPMRERLGVRMVGSTYSERWLVVDAIVRNHAVSQITFTCDPRRPRVELPAVGERVRWEFMQLPGESEETLKRDETIRALVAEAAGDRAFEIERKAVYAFHARVAEHWRRGRVFLAGDAAHLMPPFAGQGMNGGMKDASNLAWKLAAVLRGLAPDAILDTYEVERAPVVRKMVEVSRRLGAVIMPTNRIAAAARDSLFACLNLSSRFRAFIHRGGVVPPPAIHRSALTSRDRDALSGRWRRSRRSQRVRALRRSIASSAAINGSPSASGSIPRRWFRRATSPSSRRSAPALSVSTAPRGAQAPCRSAAMIRAFADWARAPATFAGFWCGRTASSPRGSPPAGTSTFFSPSPPP